MSYCTQAQVLVYESNLTAWAKDIAGKILEADKQIKKFLRNARDFDDDDIADISTASLSDLVTPASYYVLFLCYNDMSEGNADQYAAKAKDYRQWYERELSGLDITLTSDGVTSEEPSSYGGGRVTL